METKRDQNGKFKNLIFFQRKNEDKFLLQKEKNVNQKWKVISFFMGVFTKPVIEIGIEISLRLRLTFQSCFNHVSILVHGITSDLAYYIAIYRYGIFIF